MSLSAKVTGNDLIKILTDFKVSLLDLFENKENVLDKLSIDTNGNLLFDNKAITSNGSSIKMLIVDTLPTENISENTIYLVSNNSSNTNNIYTEYVYINSNWEIIGSTDIDLSNYLQKDILEEYDETKTYNIGDYVIFENVLYQCTKEISSAENFNESNWQTVIGNKKIIDDISKSSDTTYSSNKLEDEFINGEEEYTNEEIDEMLSLPRRDVINLKSIVTDENTISNEKTWNSQVLNNKFEELFQYGSDSKNKIETAITAKGGTVSKENEVATIDELIDGLSTIGGTSINLFVQTNEPETKDGIWIKSDDKSKSATYMKEKINRNRRFYNDIINQNTLSHSYDYSRPAIFDKNRKMIFVFCSNKIYIYTDDILNSRYYATKNCKLTFRKYEKSSPIGVSWAVHCSNANIGSKIFLLGSSTTVNYLFNWNTNTFTKQDSIPFNPGANSRAVYLNNYIYLFTRTKACKAYCSSMGLGFSNISNTSYDFNCGCVVASKDKIYLFGSITTKYYNTAYSYDPKTDTYTSIRSLPRYGCAGIRGYYCERDDKIYLFGINDSSGTSYSSSGDTNYVYVYDIKNNNYTQLPKTGKSLYGSCSTFVETNNAIYFYRFFGNSSLETQYYISRDTIGFFPENSIVITGFNNSEQYRTKLFNYEKKLDFLNYINFQDIVVTDDNGKNDGTSVYIGNGEKWTSI